MIQLLCIIYPMKRAVIVWVVCLCMLLCSCEATEREQYSSAPEERPDMSFENVTYTLNRGSFDPVSITASHMDVWDELAKAVLTDVTFVQTDADGQIVLTGNAETATVDTGTYMVELGGKVDMYKTADALEIHGEDFIWDNEARRISTDKAVVLRYDSDIELSAVGLTGDFATSTYSFDRITEGRLGE